jgi:TfoX/Sxy family transcriptional regulator of competence genes
VNAAEQFAALVETMLARSDATYGADDSKGARRAFGSTSLKTGGRIFAMLVKDRLVVKLPAKRVEELVVQGAGERFDPGHGRIQKEWLSVYSESPDDWLALATEAETFVSGR